jgi:hypothetical protein
MNNGKGSNNTPAATVTRINQAAPVLSGVQYEGLKYVNLTDHEINLRVGNDQMVSFPPSGTVARVIYDREQTSQAGINMYALRNPVITGLPEPDAGVVLLVSAQVRAQLTADHQIRSDVLSPYAITPVQIGGRGMKCATALAR